MKVLAINSSYRGENGYTKFLIDKVLTGAIEKGASCETITLSKLKMNHCIACDRCHSKDSFLKCIFDDKDDVRSVFNKMTEADTVIYATPVYVFTMSALLKILFERFYSTGDVHDLQVSESGYFFHHIDKNISSKPFVPLICCDNVETEISKNIVDYFKIFSKLMDAKQVGLLVRNAGMLLGHGINKEREKEYPQTVEIYKAFEEAGRELATHGYITKSTQKKAGKNLFWIPPLKIIKDRVIKIARDKAGDNKRIV